MDKNIEKTKEIVEKLIEENKNGVPILVEGNTDKKALRELGVSGDIFIIKGAGKLSREIAEELSRQSKRVIILTDPDKAGDKIAGQMSDLFESLGVHPELRYRVICPLMKVSQVAHLKGFD